MTHKDLLVWKKSMELVVMLYDFANKLPESEKYGLCSQMHRAVVSIPSNIAEGAARNTRKEYVRFLYISLGSLTELETQYQICLSLKFCNNNPGLNDKIDHVGKLLSNLIKSLKSQPLSPRVPESPSPRVPSPRVPSPESPPKES